MAGISIIAYSFPFDREAVLDFFLEFSRFEYALKRAEFLRKGTEEAQPDWDRFAQTLSGKLRRDRNDAFAKARSLLLGTPPKKQIVNTSGQLGWRESTRGQGESEEAFLLRLVRTVRNNLFHGGKFPDPVGPVKDCVRDRALIEAAIDVLRECRRISQRINSFFLEAA